MYGPRGTRVTPAEDEQVLHFRDGERLSWARIASRMNRAECTLRLAYERATTAAAWRQVQLEDKVGGCP